MGQGQKTDAAWRSKTCSEHEMQRPLPTANIRGFPTRFRLFPFGFSLFFISFASVKTI